MTDARKIAWGILAIGVVFGVVGILALGGSPAFHRDGSNRNKMRIVSLSPSVTEMLFALGVGESLVGATDHCDYPPQAKQIERVGGLGRPNVEKLLALSPDLVVATDFERNNVAEMLRQSGIQVLDVKIRNIDEMFQALRQLGHAVGKRRYAEDLVASMQAELKSVAARSGDRLRARPPRVFVEIWDDPLTTAGGGSFLDDVIARAGGVNVAHDVSLPHPRISPEKVIEWNPDAIVVVHMNRGPISAAPMAERIGWSDIAAVKNGQVMCDIPAELILRPGPRLIDGVKVLARRLGKVAPVAASGEEGLH